MPGLIRHPVSFWIALMLHYVPRLRGNDNLRVFIRLSNNVAVKYAKNVSLFVIPVKEAVLQQMKFEILKF
jgi:hypothetical protein